MRTTASLETIAQEAESAAAASGVSITLAHDTAEIVEVQDFISLVWFGRHGDTTLASRELLRALSHAGGYVALARDRSRLVGVAVGFLAAGASLHSHLVGVHDRWQGVGVGTALKLHQRVWAAMRGLSTIVWTFDPLVRRNAHVNLHRLGARVTEFAVDFYGEMPDARNSGHGSDRVFVRWEVERPLALVPRLPSTGHLLVDGSGLRRARAVRGEPARIAIPADIEDVRRGDPDEGRRWRTVVREALLEAEAAGLAIAGLTDTGEYALTPRSR